MLLLDLLVFFKELVKQGVLAQLLGHPSSWCNSDTRTCRTPKALRNYRFIRVHPLVRGPLSKK